MQQIPMEYRNIVKRMIARIDGTTSTISSRDVAREILSITGKTDMDPMTVYSSHELLKNALLNPPPGFEVFRESEGSSFTIVARRAHP